MSAKKTNETTLTQLTKRFVKLLNTSSERVINLNEASSKLSVAKRRIYDITNVLEGIGLLQKTSKNVTRWVDCPQENPLAAPIPTHHNNIKHHHNNNNHLNHQLSNGKSNINCGSSLPDAEMIALLKTFQSLEEGVNELEAKIRQQLTADGAYVTYQDIKSYFDDQIVIAVKAPPETRLEVNESLQIWMKSEGGEIEVYLCPQYGNNNSNTSSNNGSNNNNATTVNNSSNTTQQQQLQQGQQSQQIQPQLGQQSEYSNNPTNNTQSPLLQQSPLNSNCSNAQSYDSAATNVTNQNMIGSQQAYTAISSDEGRGRSISNTDSGLYYDPTSGVSTEDHYYNNDPTLSSALSGATSEDDDPYSCKSIVPFETREETHYNFMLDENYTLTSLFPEDNLGLY